MSLRFATDRLHPEVVDAASMLTHAADDSERARVLRDLGIPAADVASLRATVARRCESCDEDGMAHREYADGVTRGVISAECRHLLGWLAWAHEQLRPGVAVETGGRR